MESVKHKMETMISQQQQALQEALTLEQDTKVLKESSSNHDKEIKILERDIAKLEEELDLALTETDQKTEKLEEANKIATAAEQEVQSLERKIALIEDETKRIQSRLLDTTKKLVDVESNFEENERVRKIIDAKSLACDDKYEMQEFQLVEAQRYADEAYMKCEEAERKLHMLEREYEKIQDSVEMYENKCKEMEETLNSDNNKLRIMEETAHEQGIKEDELFERERNLIEEYKEADTRAEFGERTVDKLELTVDDLQESLYFEKKSYKEMSMKLDQTLNDIMAIHKIDQPSMGGIEVEESD